MMGVRRFRETFQELTEPTDVVKVGGDLKRVGTWYPEKPVQKKETPDG